MASTVSLKSQPPFHNFSLSHSKPPPFDSAFRFNNEFPVPSSSQCDLLIAKSDKKPTESDGKTKILLHFRTKSKTDDVVADTIDQTSIAADVEELEPRTRNLRPRKLVINGGASKSSGPSPQVIKTQPNQKPVQLKKVVEEKVGAKEEKEEKKLKLSIPLSKEEIEEDIWAMTGSRPTRRPKKRNKNVQKQLDSVFPGLWLDSITPHSYKVSDKL